MTEKIFKMIKDNEVKFVDFRFTDPRGKWQHTAQTVESVDEDLLTKGIMFDGSSISGWKSINEYDINARFGYRSYGPIYCTTSINYIL